jgi:putative DNA primase/helicase
MEIRTIRESATELAQRGVHVFPLVFRSKEPLPKSKGFHDATTDLTTIRRTWAGRLLNVAVRTGTLIHGQYLSVLDIDGDAGYAALDELERQHGPLLDTFTVRTSRGEHRYLAGPALGSRTGFHPGLDLKAMGGYVVGPCSVHPSGAVYTCADWSAPIAAAPEWLIRIVQHRKTDGHETDKAGRIVHEDRYLIGAIAGEAGRLRNVSINRNNSLFCSAVRLRKILESRQVDQTGMASIIEVELCAAAADIGLSQEEVRKTIRSAMGGSHAS